MVFNSFLIFFNPLSAGKTEKLLTGTNTRLKNDCRQKGISLIENSSIKESHLGKKKLYLNKTSKSFFAKKFD